MGTGQPVEGSLGRLSARTWTAEAGYSTAGSYNADGYVFAVQAAIDHETYDALDLDQWSFWVLPRSAVEDTGLRSKQLSKVQTLADSPSPYADLASRVRSVADGVRTSADG